MLPKAMQAALKAMETRLEARFDARFEALEAIVGHSNELNWRAHDKLTATLDMLVKRVNYIAAEHSVLLGKVEQLGAAVLDSQRLIHACSMGAVGSLLLCSQKSLAHFLQRFKSEKECLQKTVRLCSNSFLTGYLQVDGLLKIGGRNVKDIISHFKSLY
ncbi:unnamed protein product [Dibothriocephalus latus]|uniref:Uncharacterized protein n=1 Tax=Dibothriocephalus latus TaxID=60516 RepID=A0A3P7NT48_DIBLA|nr:unnamed protein product [Dibothriocephalus latus]